MPPVAGDTAAEASPLHDVLSSRGHRHVSYADWLMIEEAEKELAARLGRGARVKLASKAEIHKACGLS
jgi:ferredoxin--NADP+ reductase